MIAVCKKKATEHAQVFGDMYGVHITINLIPNQKWHVKKDGKYFHVWKQNSVKLRLTESAFNRLFEIEQENKQ